MEHQIIYCHCAFAQVVPKEVKAQVLAKLCQSGRSFESIADLCELSARRDPVLKQLASGDPVRIVACFPRAVKWLFAAANAPLNIEATEVLNMRTGTGEEISAALDNPTLQPNVPAGKETIPVLTTMEEAAELPAVAAV